MHRFRGRGVVGWVIYDFANVLFSITVVSLYFPIWLTDEAGGNDADFALISSISMAIVFVLAPLVGALTDRVPRRMPWLIALTVICCLGTIFLGSGSLATAMVLFVIANSSYLLALLVYDSLLPVVSTENDRGRISGWGFAAGFGGSLAGIVIGLTILTIDDAAFPVIFAVIGALFLACSIPCFRWVREPLNPRAGPFRRAVIAETFREVRQTARDARDVRGLRRFLVGRFLYSDATNTVFIFMSIYATKEIGFSDLQTQLVLLAGIIIGPAGALWAGSAVDRSGPKRTLNVMLIIWAAALLGVAAVPLTGAPNWLFWIVAPLIGIGIGGTATTERAYLLRLVPPDQVGRFLGLYAMVGRFAAILSPLLWVFVADWLGLGRPVAVLTLLVLVLFARHVLGGVDDARRMWPAVQTERTGVAGS